MTEIALQNTPKFMQITMCLYPRFSNFCLANALEPLRAANDLSGRPLYFWTIVTPDGAATTSSSGIEITPAHGLDTATGDALFLMPSYEYRSFLTPQHAATLRRAAGRHEIIVGLDMGAWLMAHAGLLAGRRATIHWDEYHAFSETYPDTDTRPDRVVKDGTRWSCGGATTAFDLVLDTIEAQHGASLRLDVAALFMHGEWRGALPARPSGEARVDAALALMRRHVSAPLPLHQVARKLGMSPRRLEVLFAQRLGESPRRIYQSVRLAEAKRLLQQSTLAISEVAAHCGYEDPSAMGRAFKTRFGLSPTHWRQRAAKGAAGE